MTFVDFGTSGPVRSLSFPLNKIIGARTLARVPRALEKREVSAVEVRARNSRARRLGPKINQYGDNMHGDRSELEVKRTQSDVIRLQELGFVLRQFFNLFINTWLYLWLPNSRT